MSNKRVSTKNLQIFINIYVVIQNSQFKLDFNISHLSRDSIMKIPNKIRKSDHAELLSIIVIKIHTVGTNNIS